MIRLHLPAVPHTITHDDFSHCAFTGKVKRFSPMMRSRGFEVIHYGTEGSDSGANRDVQLFTRAEWHELRIRSLRHLKPELDSDEKAEAHLRNPQAFYGDLANWSTPLYEEFNRRFKAALLKDYRKPDVVCIPLGHSYDGALNGMDVITVETGIGYRGSFNNYRIFESYTWMANSVGQENKDPNNYWFVIPNFFNVLEFPYSPTPVVPTIGFLARIGDCKGCNIIAEIAKRMPHVRFVLCGQGDPTRYLVAPNIVYKPPIHGRERGKYLGSLTAFLAPTKYLEPFGTSMVEAQLCGTPVIASDWGAMSETIEDYKTGVRCHTLQDYCTAVQMALDGKFDREYIRARAVRKYDMYTLAKRYEYVFKTIVDIHNGKDGWYSGTSHLPLTDGSEREAYAGKIHLSIAYFGTAFPNYFQLYLDSLRNNANILVVHLFTNISLASYDLPPNLVVEQMSFTDLNRKVSSFLLRNFGETIEEPILESFPYKLCEFKIAYHEIFDVQLSDKDYFGWGDIDVVYGTISNFIDLSRNYDRIGFNRAHFMALRNTPEFRSLYKSVPDIYKTFCNTSYYEGVDEGGFPTVLSKNDHVFPMSDYACDIIPERWNKRWLPAGSTATFYDTYDMTKNIRHLHYSSKGLMVTYEDGKTREVAYTHLQKRSFPDPTCRGNFYITQSMFTGTIVPKRITLLTYCTGYLYEVYRRFAGTLYDTGFSGNVIFVIAQSDEDKLIQLQKEYPLVRYHVDTMTDITRQCQQKRYFIFKDILCNTTEAIDNVLICDSRDLYFQRNIESYDIGTAELVYFLEGKKIKDCHHNRAWLTDIEACVGRSIIPAIGDNYISCSGTTYGTVKGIRAYLAAMCELMTVTIKTDYAGIDQGIHNFLLYDQKLPDDIRAESRTDEDGFVITLYYGPKWMNGLSEITTLSKTPAYIVHQWDRLPDYMRSRIYPKYDFTNGL